MLWCRGHPAPDDATTDLRRSGLPPRPTLPALEASTRPTAGSTVPRPHPAHRTGARFAGWDRGRDPPRAPDLHRRSAPARRGLDVGRPRVAHQTLREAEHRCSIGWSCSQSTDPHAPQIGTLLEVLPRHLSRPLKLELVAQRNGVVIVHEY